MQNQEPMEYLDERSRELATGNTFQLMIKYAIPTIIGMLVNALYNVVDRIFVGNIPGGEGTLGIAGVTICGPIMTLIFAASMLAGVGGAANISLSMGRGDRETAERTIANGAALGMLISLILSLFFYIYNEPLLTLFGASEDVMPYAQDYLNIILLGSALNTFGFCLNRYLLAQGLSTVSMFTMLIGAGMNTVLDPLFIFGFDMGVAGAALATILSQIASMLWVLSFFLRKKTTLHFRLRYLKPNLRIIWGIIAIGISPSALQLAMSLVQVTLNGSLGKYGGDVAISAMGVVSAVSSVLLMPIFGINQGIQPILGFNYGAKLYHRVKKLLFQAIAVATAFMSLSWLVMMLGAESLTRLFGSDNIDLLALAPRAMRIYLAALPLVGFQVISTNYFQAVGKPTHSMAFSLSRQVLFLIPAVLTLPRFFGLTGVFLAGPTADTLAALVTGAFLVRELRALSQYQPEARPAMEGEM